MDIAVFIAISMHLGFEGDYNALHPHFRVQDDNFIAGVYYNSEDNVSLYVGLEREVFENTTVEYGIVSGYSDADIMPFLRVKHDEFYLAPGVENGKLTGLIIGIEKEF